MRDTSDGRPMIPEHPEPEDPRATDRGLFIRTYGCQMNVYDSDRIGDAMAPFGYRRVDGPDQAALILLNTCHIREKAAEKVYSELGRLRAIKDRRLAAGKECLIGVAGCVAQAEGEAILDRAPFVDLVFGPQTYHRLPELVARAKRRNGQSGVLDIDFPAEPKFDFLPETSARGPSAFLSIQEGCDKFCTFCVVPYTRGAEFSRPAAQVIAEAERLVESGAIEITLLGQNVNAYHGEDNSGGTVSLGSLIRRLAEIPGLERIRYTTSHPRDVDDDLIAAHADVPQLMPFLHLPVQSGCDRILAAMNRGHTAESYLETVARLRAARPDLALSSDFIVGFPGETEADFAATLDLIAHVGFIQAYAFKYSPRPGTPAARFKDRIEDSEKTARLARLQAVLGARQMAFNESCVGQVLPVLLDRRGKRPGQLVGRSPFMQAVHVDAPGLSLGRIEALEIVSAGPNSLSARPADTVLRQAG